MKKRFLLLTGTVVISAMLMLSGCGSSFGRTVSLNSNDSSYGDSEEEETTSKFSQNSSKKDDDEAETTKSSKKSSKNNDEDEETTSSKKSSKKKNEEEEETTKKSSGNSSKNATNSTAPADWTEFRGTGYSIYLDGDEWTKTSLAGSELAFTHLGTALNGFAENINIITQDTSAYELDLEAYKDLSLEQYDQLGYDLVEVEEREVNGQEGYYVVTSTMQDGVKCYIAQWFTLVEDTAYVFTFAADEEDFEDLESEALMIYDTIEFD